MAIKLPKYLTRCVLIVLAVGLLYGSGRLYYQLTGGFTLSNIAFDQPFDPRFVTASLSADRQKELDIALNQPFRYLGKGCQSYVFASEDGKYVIKFFKYQRFRPSFLLNTFSFLPAVERARQEKIAEKRRKLDDVFISWKLAAEQLYSETGVLYVHLNKSDNLKKELVIFDKLGSQKAVPLDTVEFMVQKKAEMLCPTLDRLMNEGKEAEAKSLLDRLVKMLLFEYARGYADNDHALMQNTGVLEGEPIHIDAGQFIYNPIVQSQEIYHQEIFNKTYKFRLWLQKEHPELAKHLKKQLVALMGEQFWQMKPILNKASVGKIPNASIELLHL